jgi:hypothetical protein
LNIWSLLVVAAEAAALKPTAVAVAALVVLEHPHSIHSQHLYLSQSQLVQAVQEAALRQMDLIAFLKL